MYNTRKEMYMDAVIDEKFTIHVGVHETRKSASAKKKYTMIFY